jgi:hypothetical protein
MGRSGLGMDLNWPKASWSSISDLYNKVTSLMQTNYQVPKEAML